MLVSITGKSSPIQLASSPKAGKHDSDSRYCGVLSPVLRFQWHRSIQYIYFFLLAYCPQKIALVFVRLWCIQRFFALPPVEHCFIVRPQRHVLMRSRAEAHWDCPSSRSAVNKAAVSVSVLSFLKRKQWKYCFLFLG